MLRRGFRFCGPLVFVVLGCSGAAEPRAQLLIRVDTNAPTVAQTISDLTLSRDAAVDSLRIDLLTTSNTLIESSELVLPEATDWPISFGVVGNAPDVVLVRLRAFRSDFSRAVVGGTLRDPVSEVTIDRLLEVRIPDSDKRVVSVLLDADCRGIKPSLTAPRRTCVDADRHVVPADQGIDAPWSSVSRAGSWGPAFEVPCAAPSKPGRVCVPGGYSVLGDLDEISAGVFDDPIPLRPVVVDPHWVDEAEMTVGHFRTVVGSGLLSELPQQPVPGDPALQYCTYLGSSSAANDDMPLNCVSQQTARETCAALGGRLPTEAEWEHAARGRGQGRRFPWGNELDCCIASVGRSTSSYQGACAGEGPEKVGSHPQMEVCGGLGDVSRDGIVDLGGSVAELVADAYQPYDGACWQQAALLKNPLCTDGTYAAMRGGDWSSGVLTSASAQRLFMFGSGPAVGFRCAYEDAP